MDFPRQKHTAVALGFFDGLHLGHRAVVDGAVRAEGLLPCVCTMTFDQDAPARKRAPLLCTPSDKQRRSAALGVALYIDLPFTLLSDLSPRAFVRQVLSERLDAQLVCCGFNYTFGKGGRARAEDLAALCAEYGIACRIVPPVRLDGQPVSSTSIRTLLQEGRPEQAARLLGAPFSFDFPVIAGRQLGRTLDFPTINQRLPEGFVRPRFGVDVSRTRLDGVWRPSVTNVGVKPTVGSDAVLAETHILGCDRDLYGRRIEVGLLEFVRPERKFASVAELKQQIAKDVARAGRTEPRDAADARNAARRERDR